ncbi:hypothetical protein MKK67_09375 [Methylobacterium sp. J-072]|uniref:hypothetical protein n=1 Tax=Methylobacterium sp. J-072 TaxID=2836651 RepID=UPI001FBB5F21|nr:hypothetical protein [Methylobacterium sp. J-072]MCJ2092711.1 hypothetical protein [Methylobacterium sp. J-072]
MVMTAPITEITPTLPVATRLLRRSSPAPGEDGFVCTVGRKLDGFAPLTEQDRAALGGLRGYAQPVEQHTVLLEQEGVLQTLRRDGLIALRQRRVRILAPRRLRELAEFEAGYLCRLLEETRHRWPAGQSSGAMACSVTLP